jgi:hypothetical protein
MRIYLHVLCFVALASVAAAQPPAAPFPGGVFVNGGWVPCDHSIAIAAGKGCATSTPVQQPPSLDTPTECIPWPNAYAEPARALLCSAALAHNTSIISQPRFRVGATYNDPYHLHRMTVLSVTLALDDVEVITAQWLTDGIAHHGGDVFAFLATSQNALIWQEQRRLPAPSLP